MAKNKKRWSKTFNPFGPYGPGGTVSHKDIVGGGKYIGKIMKDELVVELPVKVDIVDGIMGPGQYRTFNMLMEAMKKHEIRYKVIKESDHIKEFPVIRFAGKFESIKRFLAVFDKQGRDEEVVYELLETWDGSNEQLMKVIG